MLIRIKPHTRSPGTGFYHRGIFVLIPRPVSDTKWALKVKTAVGTHHRTVGYGTCEINRLHWHLVRNGAYERIDGDAVEARNTHVECAQVSELGYEPAHKLSGSQGRCPDRVQVGASEEERAENLQWLGDVKVVVVSDEYKAEGLEVG